MPTGEVLDEERWKINAEIGATNVNDPNWNPGIRSHLTKRDIFGNCSGKKYCIILYVNSAQVTCFYFFSDCSFDVYDCPQDVPKDKWEYYDKTMGWVIAGPNDINFKCTGKNMKRYTYLKLLFFQITKCPSNIFYRCT